MSLRSRAYKILCARYHDVLTRVQHLNRLPGLRRQRSASFSGLEPLEPRMLLSGSPTDSQLTDYVLFGNTATVVDKDVTVADGLVGSNGDVWIDTATTTQGVEGGGELNVHEEAVVHGPIVFNDAVNIDEKATVHGNVDASGAVLIGSEAVVDGDVTSADAVAVESDATVSGVVTEFGLPRTFTPVALPSASVIVTDPANDILTTQGVTTLLLPGSYGDLSLSGQNVLNLSAGEYHFDSITIGEGLQLHLDASGGASGEVAIFVTGDVSIGSGLDVVLVSSHAQDIYLETHGDFYLDKNSDWMGTIYAPTGDIHIDTDVIMIGAAYSGSTVTIDKNASLTHAPATRLTGVSDVDPPVITAALANDTGSSDSDAITSDPTIGGTVTDDSAIASLLLTVTPTTGVVAGGPFDITAAIDPADGSFVLDRASLEALLGEAMTDDAYTVTLQAQDAFGNTSILDVSLTLDTTAAGVTTASPLPGLLTNTNVTISGQVDDPADAALLEVQFDDGSGGSGGSGGPFTQVLFDATGSYSFDTALALDGTEDGTHTIRLRVTDVAGNVSAVAETSLVLDTQVTAPVISDFQVDTGVSDSDGITNDTQLVFTGTAEPSSTVTVSEATLGVIGTVTADPSGGGWVLDASATVLADATHTFTAVAQDLAGNVSSASAPLTVVVDTAAPQIAISSPTSGALVNSNVTVQGQVTDPSGVALLEAQVDGGSGGGIL